MKVISIDGRKEQALTSVSFLDTFISKFLWHSRYPRSDFIKPYIDDNANYLSIYIQKKSVNNL